MTTAASMTPGRRPRRGVIGALALSTTLVQLASAAPHRSDPSDRFEPFTRGRQPLRARQFGGGGFGGRGGGAPADSTVQGGQLLTERGANGETLVSLGADRKSVTVSGSQAPGSSWNTKAPRPWVDRLDIETGTRTRVFESPLDGFDEFVTALDDDATKFIYTHESPSTIPDAWLKDVTTGTTKKPTMPANPPTISERFGTPSVRNRRAGIVYLTI